MAAQQTKSFDEKQPTKIIKARPAPNFSQLHSRWAEKLNREKGKNKKPTTKFQMIVRDGPVQNTSNTKSLIPRPPQPVSSAANYVKSQPSRVNIKSKKAVHGQEGIDFKAEPESLNRILNTGHTATETSRRPRESIYDRMSRKFKANEIDEGRTVSMFNMPRTPLGDLGNYPVLQSPPRTTRKSIYEKLSQIQSAKRCAQTARRMVMLASGSAKPVTWSTKLSAYKKNSPEDEAIKQRLFDEPDADQPSEGDGMEINAATMKEILEAEKKLEAKLKNRSYNVEMDDSENSYKPASSLSQFTYRQSTVHLPTPSPPASMLDQTGSNLLPAITGVSRLPHTPGHDDTLCRLANNLNLAQNYQQDGSPVLPPPTHQSLASSLAEEVCVETGRDSPRQSQNVEKPPFIEHLRLSPEKLTATTIVSDQQTDKITLSLQSLDNELKKSRRRSAALLTQPPLAGVEHELQQILAQQKMLDERRRILQEMLDCQRPSTISGLSQSSSSRVSPCSTHHQTHSSSNNHGDSLGNCGVKDVSILAQVIDETFIESPDQGDLAFHITPEDVGAAGGLQAVSTALPSIKETAEREIDSISQHGLSSAVNRSQPHQLTNKCEQALLDEETAIYTCTLTYNSALAKRRQLPDPVGQLLSFGDDQHFIPIPEH